MILPQTLGQAGSLPKLNLFGLQILVTLAPVSLALGATLAILGNKHLKGVGA